MSARYDGGPAFPVIELHRVTWEVCDQHFGMSLRDHFATKALPVVAEGFPHRGTEAAGDWAEWVARNSYALADAMLKAREAGQ